MLGWINTYIKYVEKRPQDFNKDVKNMVRLIKDLLTHKGIEYKEADPIAFEKFCRFFHHREGVWAGQPIVLNMEQRFIIACLLGIKEYSKQYGCWVRYFRELDLFVARKWGKDHFIAPLTSFFIALDKEPSAWGQIVAENKDQAYRTFEIVENNIKDEPISRLLKRIGTKEKRKIVCKANDGKLEYLSGRIKGKDGSNPSFAVANEVHEITNFNQYTALKTGMGARKQPMMLVISSAGTTPESLYEFILERNRKFLLKTKLTKTDRIFAMMYGIDDDDDVENEACWIKANPAMYEGRPTMQFLREQWQAMKDDPITKNTFIAKQLNRQIGAGVTYFNLIDIKNSMVEVKKEDFFDSYAVGGVDLAETTDLCNATATILRPDGRLLVLQAYFIAQDCLDRNSKKDKVEYTIYEHTESKEVICQKLLIVTNGSYVAKEYVTQWFCTLRDEYSVNFLKIGYDRWMAKEWLTDMQENGFSHEKVEIDREEKIEKRDGGILTAVAQGSYTLSGAIKIIKSLFEDGKIKYDKNNKLLPYCFYNLKIKVDSNNNVTPHKSKSTGHIDGAIGIFNSWVAYERAKIFFQNTIYWKNIEKYFKI